VNENNKADIVIDIVAKAPSKAIHCTIPVPFVLPRISAVAPTAPITIGKTIGKNKTGNRISLERVLTDIAEKSVPREANPNVARIAIITRDGVMREMLNSRLNIGNIAACIASMKRKLLTNLPK
jgi:hypothetical protein